MLGRIVRRNQLVRRGGRGACVTATLLLSATLLTACQGSTEAAGTGAEDDYLRQVSASLAEFYGIEHPPEVESVRYVDSDESDWVTRQCLLDAGYSTDDTGMIQHPPGQEEAFALAQYTCRMMYPIAEKYNREWGNAEVEKQYEWTRDFVIPCLEDAGYSISGLPSKEVFVDSWETRPFFPFAQVPTGSWNAAGFNERWGELEMRCPQIAPGAVLWDGLSIEEWAAQRQLPFEP